MKKALLTIVIVFPIICSGCCLDSRIPRIRVPHDIPTYVAPVYDFTSPIDEFEFFISLYEFYEEQLETECIEPAPLHETNAAHIPSIIPWTAEVGKAIFTPGKYGAGISFFFAIKLPTNKSIVFYLLPRPILLINGKEYFITEIKIVGALSSQEIQEPEEIKGIPEIRTSSIDTPIKIFENAVPSSVAIGMELFFYIDKEDVERVKEGCQLQIPFQVEVEKEKFDIPFKIPFRTSNSNATQK